MVYEATLGVSRELELNRHFRWAMPSHRRRSYSPDRSRTPSRERDRSRSRSPERSVPLPSGATPISESDYFVKNDEFRVWLKDEKRKARS